MIRLAEPVGLGINPFQIIQGSEAYPGEASAYLGDRAPTVVGMLGNLQLLQAEKLALFCSIRCPGKLILATHDFCKELRNEGITVVGGFHSPVERECLNILLRGTGSIIICPARGLEGMRVPTEHKAAMDQGRVLYLSPFKAHQRRATAQMAVYRTLLVAALADAVFLAYAHPGCKTEEFCREVLGWKKTVYTRDSDSNANLINLGAKLVQQSVIGLK